MRTMLIGVLDTHGLNRIEKLIQEGHICKYKDIDERSYVPVVCSICGQPLGKGHVNFLGLWCSNKGGGADVPL